MVPKFILHFEVLNTVTVFVVERLKCEQSEKSRFCNIFSRDISLRPSLSTMKACITILLYLFIGNL